ncbi:MAG: hypothetical protein KBT03_03845 [Bacteroidales bacterium]|nr:hypothetical protein [Candidatus Scybalousia scybalohippi]
MIISEFTKPELDKVRELGNLTNDERLLLDWRSREIPLETCAEMMNMSISTVKTKSQKLNIKIKKVLGLF